MFNFSYVSQTYQRVPPRSSVEDHKLLIVITDGRAQDKIEVIPVINQHLCEKYMINTICIMVKGNYAV